MEFTVDPRQTGRLLVDGCPIAWARWGDPAPAGGTPGIVLVHGASASIGWWDAVIAPLARDGRDVVALELSGHADSGHRESYSGAQWAREVVAVTERIAGPSLLVGHSLGGRIAIMSAAAAGSVLIPRLVLVDTPTRRPGGSIRPPAPPRHRVPRLYATLDEAIDAFRLRPREPVHATELMRRIAANAYRRADGGWRLKADVGVFGRVPDRDLADALGEVQVPLTLAWGTHSALCSPDTREFLAAAHPGETDCVEIDGYHHLTIDQGAEVAAVIASRWELLQAEPRRGTLQS